MDDGQHNIAVEVPDRLLPFWVRATAFFAAFIGLALVSGVVALFSGFGMALVFWQRAVARPRSHFVPGMTCFPTRLKLFEGHILAVDARFAFRVADATSLPKFLAAMDDGQHSIAAVPSSFPDRFQEQAAGDASIVPRLAEQADVEGLVRIVILVCLREGFLDLRKPVFELGFCDYS